MSEVVRRADVGRFLRVDPEDVQRMVDLDNLPHTKVPGEKRPMIRIFLPDFHAWLAARSRLSPKLANYDEFKRAFFEAQPKRARAAA